MKADGGFSILIIFFMVTLLVAIGAVAALMAYSPPEAPRLARDVSLSQTPDITEKEVNQSSPPLWDGAEWSEGERFEYPYVMTIAKNDNYVDMSLMGTIWRAKVAGLNDKEVQSMINKFSMYHENMAAGKQWSWERSIGESKIQAILGDGVLASVVGYIDTAGDQVRVIVFSYNTISSGENGNLPPSKICPCSFETQVFVSDFVRLDELGLL